MRLVISSPPVPPDIGPATLRLLSCRSEHRYGSDRLRWRFAVETQPGRELTVFTTAATGEQSRARPLLEALAGRTLGEGEAFDTDELIGQRIDVHLEPKPESGYPRIAPDKPIRPADAPLPTEVEHFPAGRMLPHAVGNA